MSRTKKGVTIKNDKMVIEQFLTIDESGELKLMKTKPSLRGGQIAVRLVVKLPMDFFLLELPTAEISLTPEMVTRPPVDVQVLHCMKKL